MKFIAQLTSYFLHVYEDADFMLKKKSRIVFIVSLSGFVFIPIILLPELIANGFTPVIIIPQLIMLLACFMALVFIRRGQFAIASNSVLTILLAAVWITIFFDSNADVIAKLDTMIFVPALMAMAPIVVIERKIIIVVYSLINIIIFIIFNFYIQTQIEFSDFAKTDFLTDNLVSLVLVGLVSYLIFTINRDAYLLNKDLLAEQQEKNRKSAEVIETVGSVSERLNASVDQMSASIEIFYKGTQTQASSVEEVTSTMEEITSNTESIYNYTKGQHDEMGSVLRSLKELSIIVGESGAEIKKVIDIRDSLNNEAENTRKDIKEIVLSTGKLTEEIREIEGVIAIIDDISDKINLLSLNAAIEAARAGDSGRGFAVVADEISKLADQTAENVKSISNLIKKNIEWLDSSFSSLQSFEAVLKLMLDHIVNLSASLGRMEQLSEKDMTLNTEIANHTTSVMQMADTIKISMEEQKMSVAEILQSMTLINDSTQDFASASSELADTSRSVLEDSNELKEVLKNA